MAIQTTKNTQHETVNLEFRAELLKERIYATLALLAILLTLDAHHTTPIKAASIVLGTAFSLWLASLVSSQMSYRIIMRRMNLKKTEMEIQSLRRSPLLLAAVMPVLLILSATLPKISMELALNLAIGFSLALLVGWSLMSARAMKAGRFITMAVAAVELAIGLGIVGLKMLVGH